MRKLVISDVELELYASQDIVKDIFLVEDVVETEG